MNNLSIIFSEIRAVGGTPLIVGGWVRDQVLGVDSKDVDVEVYGLALPALQDVLSRFGVVDTVGASFGVLKLHGLDVDWSVPRLENKLGKGHKGFAVTLADLTPEQAARRRDFTFNALAFDPLTGETFDFFNGRSDLRRGILRRTSDQFGDDPLRVLRGFQFCGRFDLMVETETAHECWKLGSEFDTLAVERVWAEWWKWATKSVKPSAGLHFLWAVDWLGLFDSLNNLVNVRQDLEWHPEGDVFTHTCQVVDAAAQIAIRDGLNAHDRGVLVLAALLHDIGKADTTFENDEGRIVSPGHAQAGVRWADHFLRQIGAPGSIIDQVVPLVAEHLAHLNEVNPRSVRRLARRLGASNIHTLVRLIEADHSGRAPLPATVPAAAQEIVRVALQQAVLDAQPQPIVMGRHLVAAGWTPGPALGAVLRQAFEAQLDGAFDTLAGGLAWVNNPG